MGQVQNFGYSNVCRMTGFLDLPDIWEIYVEK